MSQRYITAGFQAITPYLCVLNYQEFLEFAKDGLGAEILDEKRNDDGAVFYATLRFDDSVVRTQEAWNAEAATPAMLYFYVPDAEKAYARAIGAGASPIPEKTENLFGDQDAVVTDKWGNFWWFATCSD